MVGCAFQFESSSNVKGIGVGEDARRPKEWLPLLLRSKFFGACEEHGELRKGEKNIYCVNCNACMCPHCVAEPAAAHRAHRLLQIRRYVYQNVVRIHDIRDLLDCSQVQPFTVNSAKVVLLNRRRQSKPSKVNGGSIAACVICARTVTEPYRYCSIACKVSEGSEEAAAISGDDDGGGGSSDGNRSGPFLPSDVEQISPCSSSRQPSDSSHEITNGGRRTLAPKPKITQRRRKGHPRRAPFF